MTHGPAPHRGVRPERLWLVPVGPLDRQAGHLDWLAGALAERLALPVLPGEPLPLRPEWLDAARGQFRSDLIVDALAARDGGEELPPPSHWVLGVTAADLFAPGTDSVFGEATLGGAWALISLARLQPLDSLRPGALLRRRTFKEALHELGHLAGLPHCERPACVMSASADVAEADRKRSRPCPACMCRLRDSSGLDRLFPAR